jgi:hypothetical protein
MTIILEPELDKFLSKSKNGDKVILTIYGAVIVGKFIEYNRNTKIVDVETITINGNSIASNLKTLDRNIISWGNPITKTAGAF